MSLRWTCVAAALLCGSSLHAGDGPLVLDGFNGPGKGKHIVLVSGDEEYRSEEMIPQLAKTWRTRSAGDLSTAWLALQLVSYGFGFVYVVNPNNPDGRLLGIQTLRELARDVGRLVVDESFIAEAGFIGAAAFTLRLGRAASTSCTTMATA